MLLYFGRNPVLVVSYAEGASYITKTHDIIFADRPALGTFKRLLYDCKDVAMAPYGDYWRRVRSICVNQLLSYKRVQSFSSVREEEIGQMIEEIRRLSKYDNRRVNLSKLFSNLTSDVICRVAFGMKFNGEKDGIKFKDLLEKHEELLGRFNVGDFIPWLSWINHVNGVENEIKKTNRDMDKVLEDMVEVHLDKMRKNQGTNNNEETTQDFIDVLLELQKDEIAEMSVNKESIKAIIVDMFVAGSTTTFATLEWAMSELLRNPMVMESLKKEVRGITKGKASITENDLEKMEYLNGTIKETLRLHPPAPLLLPRISSKEIKLSGYDIPAKTQVIINAWGIQRDPTFWKELKFSTQKDLWIQP
ncbi:Cytochrome P450 71A26 [Bienertia sinuspersici]